METSARRVAVKRPSPFDRQTLGRRSEVNPQCKLDDTRVASKCRPRTVEEAVRSNREPIDSRARRAHRIDAID